MARAAAYRCRRCPAGRPCPGRCPRTVWPWRPVPTVPELKHEHVMRARERHPQRPRVNLLGCCAHSARPLRGPALARTVRPAHRYVVCHAPGPSVNSNAKASPSRRQARASSSPALREQGRPPASSHCRAICTVVPGAPGRPGTKVPSRGRVRAGVPGRKVLLRGHDRLVSGTVWGTPPGQPRLLPASAELAAAPGMAGPAGLPRRVRFAGIAAVRRAHPGCDPERLDDNRALVADSPEELRRKIEADAGASTRPGPVCPP
jgi:hypothetical protein